MRLRISRCAKTDLDEIFDYWAHRAGPDIAGRVIYAITDHFPLLAEAPNIGRKCDDLAPGARSFPVGKYLVYYRFTRGIISILHVFHGARDQLKAFGRN